MFLCYSDVTPDNISDLDSVCRVCLRKEYLNEIFKYQDTRGDHHDLSVNMKLCSGIEINDKDSLPKNICDPCVQLLSSAFEFRTLCVNSHRKLLDILKVKQECSPLENNSGRGFEIVEASVHSNLSSRCGKDSPKLDCENRPENEGSVITLLNHEYTTKVSFEQSFAYYGCLLCEKQFGDKLSLDMHMAAVHSHSDDIQEFKCPRCSKDFPTERFGRAHETNGCLCIPHGKVQLCRPKGGVGSPRTLELPPLLLCPHCPRLLATPGSLHKHQALHSSKKNYICEVCGKQFPRSDYLSIHTAIHAPRESLMCDKCSYTATSRSSLVMHARTHSGERPFVCEACGYAAVNISNLNRHLRSHSKVKDYKCEECGKQYGYKSLLKDHLASVHQKLRRHKCQFCQETYTRRNGLLRHLHKKHPK